MEKPKYPVQTVIKALEIIEILAQDSTSRGIGINDSSHIGYSDVLPVY